MKKLLALIALLIVPSISHTFAPPYELNKLTGKPDMTQPSSGYGIFSSSNITFSGTGGIQWANGEKSTAPIGSQGIQGIPGDIQSSSTNTFTASNNTFRGIAGTTVTIGGTPSIAGYSLNNKGMTLLEDTLFVRSVNGMIVYSTGGVNNLWMMNKNVTKDTDVDFTFLNNSSFTIRNVAGTSALGIVTLGNITAGKFIGNGAGLTGLPTGMAKAEADTYYLSITSGNTVTPLTLFYSSCTNSDNRDSAQDTSIASKLNASSGTTISQALDLKTDKSMFASSMTTLTGYIDAKLNASSGTTISSLINARVADSVFASSMTTLNGYIDAKLNASSGTTISGLISARVADSVFASSMTTLNGYINARVADSVFASSMTTLNGYINAKLNASSGTTISGLIDAKLNASSGTTIVALIGNSSATVRAYVDTSYLPLTANCTTSFSIVLVASDTASGVSIEKSTVTVEIPVSFTVTKITMRSYVSGSCTVLISTGNVSTAFTTVSSGCALSSANDYVSSDVKEWVGSKTLPAGKIMAFCPIGTPATTQSITVNVTGWRRP